MGFSEAIKTVLKEKYATFSGRASRSEFWWFTLFYWLLLMVTIGIGFLGYSVTQTSGASAVIFFIPAILIVLGMIVPVIALSVRRFHDRNLSGWIFLVVFLASNIPYIGFVASIAMLVIDVLKGTEGPNRFGDDPLQPTAVADVFA